MNIEHVQIENATEPVSQWWEMVRSNPGQITIRATITMTLSWSEYRDLLDKESKNLFVGDDDC